MKLITILEATLKDIQRKIPIWTKKYKQEIPEDILSQIVEPDPTKGKYSEWLIRQYLNKTTNFPEDNEELKRNLELFHAKKSKLTNKDINQYTPQSLADALDQELGLTKSERKAARRGDLKLPPGAEVVAENGPYQGVEVTFGVGVITSDVAEQSINAAIKLSSGTKWCTANQGYARQYLEQGSLFVIYKDGKRVALVHYESDQWMNVDDKDVRKVDKSSFVDYVNLLSGYTGVGFEDDPKFAVWYARHALKRRWPEGEPVIIKDPKSIVKYAIYVIRGRWPEAESIVMRDPAAAAEYAAFVVRGRWPEAEPIIAKNPDAAFAYVKYTLKRRWPEGESAISENGHLSYHYAEEVIKGRFPEGEESIIEDALSGKYARNIIGGRWPEAEQIVIKDPRHAYIYARDAIGDRWPEAEPTIIKSVWYAYFYAKDVIKGRWLEAEPVIMQDRSVAEKYRVDVMIPAYQKSIE